MKTKILLRITAQKYDTRNHLTLLFHITEHFSKLPCETELAKFREQLLQNFSNQDFLIFSDKMEDSLVLTNQDAFRSIDEKF